MKKICFSLIFALVFLSSVMGIKAQSQGSAFEGMWVLDKEKTKINKDFPQKLKNYKMLVASEGENLLNVKSQIEGNVEIESVGGNSSSGGSTGSSTSPSSTYGVRMDERSSGVGGTGKVNYGGTMALFFTTNDASYNLNGEEVKIETKQGLVRVKAKPDKSGKALQFTVIRRMRMPKGEMEVYVREAWKLSEDGNSLKFQRTVETPTARDEINMVLSKAAQ